MMGEPKYLAKMNRRIKGDENQTSRYETLWKLAALRSATTDKGEWL